MSYSKKVLYFSHTILTKYNIYNKNFNNICYDYVGNYGCGDIIFFQIFFHYFNYFIFNIKYKVYGCGSAISSVSLSSLIIMNKFYYCLLLLRNIHISSFLKLPSLKYHCSIFSQKLVFFNLYNFKSNYIIYYF